jgi:hypothetical protein
MTKRTEHPFERGTDRVPPAGVSRRSLLQIAAAAMAADAMSRAESALATGVDEPGQVPNSGQDRRQRLQSILDNYGPELGAGN